MDLSGLVTRLALALAIGFVVGLERGWKEREEGEGRRAAGIRTFALIGLLGGLFAALSPDGDRVLLAAGFIVTSAVMAVFVWRENLREGVYGATTIVAAMVTFVLGATAVLGDMRIAAGAGVVTVSLLAYKAALHGFLSRLKEEELRSGLLLAAMTFIALPLLPDRALDPWGALNPHQLWLITILIAAVSFLGYVAVKLAGPERGLVLAATLGGLVSSTVVTVTLAGLARPGGVRRGLLAGSILASGAVMMARVVVVAGLLNPGLALALAPPLAAAAAVQAIAAWLLVGRGTETGTAPAALAHRNPFLLPEVLRFGAILGIVMLASGIAKSLYGSSGLMAVAAFSGFADVDAITLSVATMGPVAPGGVTAVLLAIGVNTLAKAVYAGAAGGARLGLWLFGLNLAALTAGAAAYALSNGVMGL